MAGDCCTTAFPIFVIRIAMFREEQYCLCKSLAAICTFILHIINRMYANAEVGYAYNTGTSAPMAQVLPCTVLLGLWDLCVCAHTKRS